MHKAAGDSLCILILSASAGSRRSVADYDEVLSHRQQCARSVAEIYGAELHISNFLDNHFDTVPQVALAQAVEDLVGTFQPTVLYTHSVTDLSRDHELVARAAVVAARPFPGSSVRTVLSFEVRSSTEWGMRENFKPTWFQPLTADAVATKLQALKVYTSEMREWPHSRSIEAVEAQLRLRGSQVGESAAEAFELIRCTRTC
jgi:LmbE family N-acetylglucosaminyl deacetylase